MKRSLLVFLRNSLVVCLRMPVFRRRTEWVLLSLFVLLGALICPGTAEARPQGSAPEFVLSDFGADKEAGKLLTALTDRAVPTDAPILEASLASMEIASAPGNTEEKADAPAERKDAPPDSAGDAGSDKADSAAPAAPAAETNATPNPASRGFGEVDELDLFLFELSEAEQGTAPARETSRPNPDAAPVTAPENSLGGGGTSSSPSNTPQPASPAPAAETDSRVPSTEPASRSSEGKGVSGISLTELADAVPVAVLGRETATAGVMPIEEIPPNTHTWNKQSPTGGDLEWHSLTDWGGNHGYAQGDKVILEGNGGDVYLCGFDDWEGGGGQSELSVSTLELNDASWTFRSVGATVKKGDGGSVIDVDPVVDEVNEKHTLKVTESLTMNNGSGLLLGKQTSINVEGKLVTGNNVSLSLGEDSTLSIGKLGEGASTADGAAALSMLTFESGSALKLHNFGTLSVQSVQLGGNATLEMDVSGMDSNDHQLKLEFLGGSTDFSQSDNYLTIKLTGLTVEHVNALTDPDGGGSLKAKAYCIFGDKTPDQGSLLGVLNIVTWEEDLYSPFYVHFDPDTKRITVRVKDRDLYWKHSGVDHDWRVMGSPDPDSGKDHWETDGTPGAGKGSLSNTDTYFPSGDNVWHGDTYFVGLGTGVGDKEYMPKTRDEGHDSYEEAYSFYWVDFEGGEKKDMEEMEHIAVSMRGNMTVGAPAEGKYYWFKPRAEKKYEQGDGEPNGVGGLDSGAVDEKGNIHLEKDGHEQHQFQLVIGRADTGNFTEDKLILENSVRFSGNVAFNANVMTNFESITNPYDIADGTELMVGDGATFYRALNRSKRDGDGKVTEYGFDGTLVIWSQNSKDEEGRPQHYEWVANRLREGGDIIHLHVEQNVGGRLQIGKDGEEATYDGTVTLTVEELTGGVNIRSDGDIYGDTLILNDNGRQQTPQYDGTIASSLVYSHSENYGDNGGTDDRVYRLNNDFRGPRLTVKEGQFEVQCLRPMYHNSTYKWLKGKNNPESDEYVYDERYDTDSRVVVEKDGKLTIEYLTPASKTYEGDGSGDSNAWCDVVVMGEGEGGGGRLNFELWEKGTEISEDVPVKSLWTGAGSEVTIGQPDEQGKQGNTQTARKLTVKYLGGAGGTIKDVVEGGDKSTLILDYNEPNPENENYGVYRKEFEGEYAEFDHYGGEIAVNFEYAGTADYVVDGGGKFTGQELTMDGLGTLTLTNAVGDTGKVGSGGADEDFADEDYRPTVNVLEGTLVLEEESHIGELTGNGKSGTLVLGGGGSIKSMSGEEDAKLWKLEVADHLTLDTGHFYFHEVNTRVGDDLVKLNFELAYEEGTKKLTGTTLHVDSFVGVGNDSIEVQLTKGIVDALKSALTDYLTAHPESAGEGKAEWQLFEGTGYAGAWKEEGIFLGAFDEGWLGDDRRILYLNKRGYLVMEDLKDDVYWLGGWDPTTGEAPDDVWEAKSEEKDWLLTDRDSDHVERTIETAFRGTDDYRDNVHFDREGKGHTEVTYSGEVQPDNMTVEDLDYSFTPRQAGDSITVHGDLTVNNARATFNGANGGVTVQGSLRGTSLGTVDVQGGTFTVGGELEDNGADGFGGTLEVRGSGTRVTLQKGGALHNLVMSDGTLTHNGALTVEGLSGEGGEITGGDLRLTDSEGEFGGEISSALTYAGTLYELYGKYTGKGLTVEGGRLKITGANEEDGKTLKLGQNGEVSIHNGAGLVLGGERFGGGEKVESVEMVGNLTLSGEGTTVEMYGTKSNKVSGKVTLGNGTTLSMSGSESREIIGTLTLNSGATLRWKSDNPEESPDKYRLVVGDLKGGGRVDNGGVLEVKNGTDSFDGFFVNSTGLALDEGNLTLTQEQVGLGAVAVGSEDTAAKGATLTFKGEENTASGLAFVGTESKVVLGVEASATRLNLSDLSGGAGNSIGGAEGSSVSLNYSGKEHGQFSGDVSVDFEYTGSAAEDPGFTLGDKHVEKGGSFTGKNLTVHSGKLTVSQALTRDTEAVTLGGGSSTLTLLHGGELTTLHGGNGNLVLGGCAQCAVVPTTHIGDMGGSSLTSLQVQGVLKLDEKNYALGDITLTGDTTLDFNFTNQSQGTKVYLSGLSGLKPAVDSASGHSFTLQFSWNALNALQRYGEYHLFFEDDGCEWHGYEGLKFGFTGEDGRNGRTFLDDGTVLGADAEKTPEGQVYLDSEGILHWRDASQDPGGVNGALTWRAEDGVWQRGSDENPGEEGVDPTDDHRDWFGYGVDLPENRDNFDLGDNVKFTDYYVDPQFWKVKVEGLIEAGRMSVTGGDYTFSAKDEKSSLSVHELDISSAATAEFSVGTTVQEGLRNAGELTVAGTMSVGGALTGKGDTTVTAGGTLTVTEELTDYAGTLTLEKGGSVTAHGAVKDLHVGAGGGNLTANGDTTKLEAELTSGTNAGQLNLRSGTFDLTGRTAGAVGLEGSTVLNAYDLSVGGVNGGGDNSILSGTLTVTGKGGSYAGGFRDLDITVARESGQAFTKKGQTLKSARVEAGGELDLADQTEVSNALTVDGTVKGNGYLKAPSLQGTTGGAQVTAGTLELTGAAGSGSQYAGSVTATSLVIDRGTHTFGNATFGTGGNSPTGGVTLNNGSHLHIGGTIDLRGTLTLTLSDVYKGSSLMSAIGTYKYTGGPVQLSFGNTADNSWDKLTYGTYYLVTAEDAQGSPLSKYRDGFTITSEGVTGLNQWRDRMQQTAEDSGSLFRYDWQLHVLEDENSLVLDLLRVFDTSKLGDDDLVWRGDGQPEDVWRNDLPGNWWPKDQPNLQGIKPDGKNLYFLADNNGVGYDGGSSREHMVRVNGTVTPGSVHAYGGEYTFVPEGGEGGIKMEGDFVVDGGRLHMQMKNTSIPEIELQSGAFFIEHEEAVPGNTQVTMSGGLLGFGEKTTETKGGGELYKNSGVWKDPGEIAQHLFLKANQLRIQAGKTYAEFMQTVGAEVHNPGYVYDSPADEEDTDKDVVIGSDKVTPKGQQNVVPQALAQGVEKTGRFGLTLRWNDEKQETKVAGGITVREGRLTLRSYGTGKMTLEGGDLTIAKGGTLHLWGGKGQNVEVKAPFTATDPSTPRTEWLGDKYESRVVLGYEGDGASYNVKGNNSAYDGTIVLRGNSKSDTAVFQEAAAAGHNPNLPATRLELHGRALTFDSATAKRDPEKEDTLWVNEERIEVVKDTENLVGGYTGVKAADDPNAKVWLSGQLTGEGVLANAMGSDAENSTALAFHHTYSGALKDFKGTIVAGLSGVKNDTTTISDSTWRLLLEDATRDGDEYHFKMAGTGEIQLKAGVNITLTGVVGDLSTDKHHGNTVDLTNIGEHDITLAGASTTTGKLTTNANGGNFILDGEYAKWAGRELHGGGSFTLVEGELTKGKDFTKVVEGDVQPQLIVDAKGTVNVNGMDVDRKVGDITITGTSTVGEGEAQRVRHGRLVGVNSDIDTEKRKVKLVFDEYNFSSLDAMIQFMGNGEHSLKVTQNAADKENPDKGLVLDFTTRGLVDLLKAHNKTNGNVTDLRIVGNGTLRGIEKGKEETFDGGHLLRLLTEDNGYGDLLYELGFTLNAWKADKGILSLSGTSKDVYLILDDREGGDYGSRPHDLYVGLYEGANNGVLESSASVVVDHGQKFTVHFGKKAGTDGMLDPKTGRVWTELTLRNLIGLEDSTLDVRDERELSEGDKAKSHVTVELVNAEGESKDDTAYGPDYKPVEDGDHTVRGGQTDRRDGFNVRGQDTTFEGVIKGGATVDFVKKGAGQLTVGSAVTGSGGLDVQGVLKLMEGGVTLQGNAKRVGNLVGTLAFAYAEKAESKTGLSLTNGADATVHDIVEEEETGGDITLGKESVFTFNNSERADKSVGTTLKDTRVKAAAEEGGEEDEESKKKVAGEFVVKGKGTDLTLAGASTVEGVNVTVGDPKPKEEEQKDATKAASEDAAAVPDGLLTVQGGAKVDTEGTLTVQGDGVVDLQGSKDNKVGSLVGDGTLSGEEKARLTVTGSDSDFHGTLTTSTPGTPEQQRGSATLGVVDGAVLNLKDVITDPARAWNLDIVRKGKMVLGKTEAARNEKQMRFGDIDVQGGGNLTIEGEGKSYVAGDVQVDKSNGEKMGFTVGLNGEKGRIWLDLTFNEKGGNELNNPDLANAESKNVEDFVDLGFEGVGSSHYEGYLRRDWNPQDTKEHWAGQWYIGLEKRKGNPFFRWGDHKNVQAGAALAWDADDPDSMAGGYLSSPEGKDGDLAHAIEAVKDGATEEDRLLAALAGSSISTLTAAMIEDVKRQLESLRSRAAMLSNSEPRGNLEMDKNKWQAWINAEMGRHDLDHESWGPGYRLTGWGGTVGGGYEMSPRTTLGLAVTAMYNDITTDGADFAKGDIDFVYLSSFMRTHLGRWTHTVLAAVAAVDVSLDRTVRYETAEYAGSYKTFGNSTGMAMGFEYELAYNKKLNESGTFVVQPLFNLQYRHAHVNAYTEKGSDAGLYINEVKTNLFTLGVGSRLQGVISDDAFGHTSFFEGRAMLKMDTGHNTGRANVRFKHGNLAREVESGPTGIFGIEIGAGCTVSLGIRGATFFVDSSAEFRDHYTNINASTGFRLSF